MKYTFKQFQTEYPTDEACLDRILIEQYGGIAFTCPGCGVEKAKFSRITKRRAYACQECGHHVYPCVGTIFEKSSALLTKWFHAMYLMTSTRNGVAAKRLERELGVTYKCAWRIASQLRKLMATADDHGPLGGHVEIDETWVGGKQSPEDRAKKGSNKTIVIGMAERGGKLRAGPIPNTQMSTLHRIISDNIEPGSTISTDEWPGYRGVGSGPFTHGTVNHGEKEYVNGIHHVNTLEGHWSHFKRAIVSTHVHVSNKHMWKYVSEFSYRRNMRHSHDAMFDRLMTSVSMPVLGDD